VWHELGRREQAHLRRGRVQSQNRYERERKQRHLVAELGDRLRRPQLQELPLPQQRRRFGLDLAHAALLPTMCRPVISDGPTGEARTA
jgi:hypothetical protein